MPIVSKGYILDIGLDESDKTIGLIFENGNPLMCTLTHVDMAKNVNKFHILHALHSDKGFILYSRSGRTGMKGRISFKQFSNAGECVVAFKALFKELTANVWEFRDRFEHRMGYHAVFSYGEKTPDFAEFTPPPVVIDISKKSKMNEKVEYLINLFCGDQTTKTALDSMDIEYDKASNGVCKSDLDYDKLPVGMMSQRNLQTAKLILEELRANLEGLTPEKITRYSERYYAYIPLKASRGHPPKLDNLELIDSNLDRVEDLSNITRTLELIDRVKVESVKENVNGEVVSLNETLLKSMNHSIVPIDRDNFMYHKILEFMKNSHGGSHHFGLKPLMIFEVLNPYQKEIYDKNYGKSTRKELLVHGSRLSNWRSILEKGLLLDPSKVGAPITGKMFGNGIYWANSFSKSAQYCGMGGYQKSTGKEVICLALAEVAVGHQMKCTGGGSYSKSSLGKYDSVWGIGMNTPGSHYDHNGVHVPTGPLVQSPVRGQLFYDEKIIYDQNQYYFRYLVIAERG